MHIEKQYSHYRESFEDRFYIKISVKENNTTFPFLRNTDDLVDFKHRYINIENLSNEEFLKKHNIEYIIEENQTVREEKIIPIGLFEFDDYDEYSYSELFLCHIGIQRLYKVEAILNNIEKAIEIKYKSLKFRQKCKQNFVEQIDLQSS